MKNRYNWNLIIGMVITGVVLFTALLSFFWTPYDPTAMDAALKNQAPSFAHIFGTDNFGGIFSVE